ncbi:hypothetical protein LQZ18_16500 [Lachnospiraceae bacterium ZAX-1]
MSSLYTKSESFLLTVERMIVSPVLSDTSNFVPNERHFNFQPPQLKRNFWNGLSAKRPIVPIWIE